MQMQGFDGYVDEPSAPTDVAVTGSPMQLEALRSTVALNRPKLPGACEVSVEELEFGDEAAGCRVLASAGPFDVVLGSDVSYLGPALPALCRTLRQMCGVETVVLLGHSGRRDWLRSELFDELDRAGFVVTVVAEKCPEGADDDVIVLECRMKRVQDTVAAAVP